MGNPVFQSQPSFGDSATKYAQDNYADQYRQQYGQTATDSRVSPGYQDVQNPQGFQGQTPQTPYYSPTDATTQTRRLTYDDVIIKTAGMFAIVVITGAISWQTANPALFYIGIIGGLALGLINSFKKSPSPALITAYAAFQGLMLGGISQMMEARYPGIVIQAVLATGATVVAVLALHASGKFRVTAKFKKWVFTLTLGYGIFVLINFLFSLFGAGGAWGFRNGTLGLVIGLFAVGLAQACLLIDFDDIRKGVEAGVDAKFAWTAAFALLVTIIWMYIEFLRILSILRD